MIRKKRPYDSRVIRLPGIVLIAACSLGAAPAYVDRTHPSAVLGEARHYRLFLPSGYATSKRAYPVIYYFHGHSDRYTLEKYDGGKDTVPKIAAFVARNPVIVVAVDGYVARDYTGFYGGAPWDIAEEGGRYDFGAYFLELAAHIDKTFRTIPTRRHRATSGLSMGGFMSLALSARYPDRVGSASAFNPGPEFFLGDEGRRTLWRPKDHVTNHTRSMIRLVRASGDYISQYHEETHAAYARTGAVNYEYRRDEYHRHWATSIEETFAFHLRAFANVSLDTKPEVWSHTSAYSVFEAWGWRVAAPGDEPGITYLEEVHQGGLRIATRAWAPDGPPLPRRRIVVTTAPLYSPGAAYRLIDRSDLTGSVSRTEVSAGADGRLSFSVDGAGHQIGFVGPGTGSHPPVLLPVTAKDSLRLDSGRDVALPLRIYNPRGEQMRDLRVQLSSEYATVEVLAGDAAIPMLDSGATIDLAPRMRVRFTAGDGYFARVRLKVKITYDGWQAVERDIDVLVVPENLPAPIETLILDGRTATLSVFRQKGNQGGGGAIPRTVTEGKGNGNGILEPGEEATVWVRLRQGLDPFDKNNWSRAKVYTESPWVSETDDVQEPKQREWTGAKERTSVIRLAAEVPPGTVIPLLLDNESWSFHFTPDIRYGVEPLYQAFQLHRRHLHRFSLQVPVPGR